MLPLGFFVFLLAIVLYGSGLGFSLLGLFGSFALAAVALNLFSGMANIHSDRQILAHRDRPFASGDLSFTTGMKVGLTCWLGAIIFSVLTQPPPALVFFGLTVWLCWQTSLRPWTIDRDHDGRI